MVLPLLSAPKLRHSAVHVWAVRLDDPAGSKFELMLSADERSRAARFHFEHDRRRFTVARAYLRGILSAYTGMDAAELTFLTSPYGKPSLKNAPLDIRFNVSHSGSLATVAITTGREIGIDIEKIRDDLELDLLAHRFFSPTEVETFCRAKHPKNAVFFRTWTCKEAFLKAQGMGLSLPLDCFDVEVDMGKPAALLATRPDATEAGRWCLRVLQVEDGFAAAVAARESITELSILTP